MKKIIILILVFTIMTTIFFKYNEIVVNYYIWNLSDEKQEIRDINANKIIELDSIAIPFLINQLEKRFIFETEYVIYCLEEITNMKPKYYDTN